MGTNYYLVRREPREVHDCYHIAKRSGGWRTHFQDSREYEGAPWKVDTLCSDPEPGEPPRYSSVSEIRRHIESGAYDLADEYGEVWSGAEALAEFDRLLGWCPDGLDIPTSGDYRDPEGFRFTSTPYE